MGLNWIDAITFLVVMYWVWEGWTEGLVNLAAGLGAFLGSLWLAIRLHDPVGNFWVYQFGVAPAWGDVLGYISVAVVGEAICGLVLGEAASYLNKKWHKSKLNKALGSGLSVARGLVLTAFIFLVILALPVQGQVKTDIRQSVTGSRLVRLAEKYGGQVKSSLDRVAAEAVEFVTVRPQSDERLTLPDLPECVYRVNGRLETQMWSFVNLERQRIGVPALVTDEQISGVARVYSQDMFTRKYFSHVSPEGWDGAGRMTMAGIRYSVMGENLAYAPDLAVAHRGLMDSPGHRQNILDAQFNRVGIGIIDGGICGIMVTQEFAD